MQVCGWPCAADVHVFSSAYYNRGVEPTRDIHPEPAEYCAQKPMQVGTA
jgi:hypothetical protein